MAAMEPRLIRVDDAPPRPWKNGGGVARDLLVLPGSAAWRCQVSVADVESDGPFSAYPGVERWFALLKGRGVALTVDGRTHVLTRTSAPFRFAGSAQTTCRLLDGPTRDLNVMLAGVPGSLTMAADGEPWRPDAAHCGVFTAVAGRCRSGAAAIDVPAYALLWFDRAPAEIVFDAGQRPAGATAWWIAVALEAGA